LSLFTPTDTRKLVRQTINIWHIVQKKKQHLKLVIKSDK
jgi:hypothetical protein